MIGQTDPGCNALKQDRTITLDTYLKLDKFSELNLSRMLEDKDVNFIR